MRRSLTAGLFAILLVIGVSTSGFEIRQVEASGTIYIRADGSIDPLSANITTLDNVTYCFTNNNYDGIVVERDHIVVDGAGYAIQGNRSGTGIDLSGRHNVTIKNVNIDGFFYGIHLSITSNSSIYRNNIINNKEGITFSYSNYNSATENHMADNGRGIYMSASANNIISQNRMNNVLFVCETGIHLFSSSNNTILKNNLTQGHTGIGLGWSHFNVLSENNITDWTQGIRLLESDNNTLTNNNLSQNALGAITLSNSSGNLLRRNVMTNNVASFGVDGQFMNDVDVSNTVDGKPIYYWINKRDMTVPFDAGYVALINCTNITVKNLNLNNNVQGLVLVHTHNSTIVQNNIITFIGFCIFTWFSSNNTIFHNNIIAEDGRFCVGSHNSANIWDNGYPAGGNYWYHIGYHPEILDLFSGSFQNETGADGIGDTAFHWLSTWDDHPPPFVVNQDNYPLMEPWTQIDTAPPIIHILSPQNATYKNSSISLHFKLYDTIHMSPISWISYSLDGDANVTITGNTTLTDLPNGSHTLMLFASDEQGNTQTKTIQFTVLLGDLNNDGKVDVKDIAQAALAFGSFPTHPRWNSEADINKDGKIDMKDLATVALHFGETF